LIAFWQASSKRASLFATFTSIKTPTVLSTSLAKLKKQMSGRPFPTSKFDLYKVFFTSMKLTKHPDKNEW
jgi:hypothetical protein